jgi:lipopolysaccharide export system ATP-binding protein
MSYTNERDEIAELFGSEKAPKRGAYADEGSPAPAGTADRSAGAPPEVKKPVKLRPPGHLDPHPLDSPPPRPAPPATAAPAPDFPEDEEFLVAEDDLPDFFGFDLSPSATEKAGPTPPVSELPPRRKSETAAPSAKTPPAPASPKAEPTRTPAPAPAPQQTLAPGARTAPEVVPSATGPEARARIRFESDEALAHSDTSGSLLQTHGLVKIYDGRTVVNGVDIHVRPGEIVGLLGPNGAGKTTSFYMIVGLVPPNGGEVLFDGHDVTRMPMYQRARLGMGYLPQEESIFRKLTVEENLLAVLETLDLSRKARLARCQELLERFSITHIRKNVALTCSGGEKRRLTIARSLVTMPSLLMLDEPFSGVDPIAVNEIQGIVEDLRKSGLAILITDHNARQTLELVDRAYLIYEGRVLREGTRDFLINDPVSRELYLGDRFTM